MEDDDKPIGRVLSRRQAMLALGLIGAGAVALRSNTAASNTQADFPLYLPYLARPASATATPPATAAATATSTPLTPTPTFAATSTPASTLTPTPTGTVTAHACVVQPELTIGPYFVDEMLNRSDIRSDPSSGQMRDGALLQLTLRVAKISNSVCTVLPNAQVDIWHCDAAGQYSDVSDPGFSTKGQKWLRGYQVTDSNGTVQFNTIYPGWYSSRAVHIHFRIRSTSSSGETYDFVSQFFFDDTFTDQVFTQAPYAAKGTRDTRNSNDNIYSNGGSQLTLPVVSTTSGYAAAFDIGMQL